MVVADWQQVETDGSTMRMHVSIPEGSGPFPGLLVIQHQGGIDEFMQLMTRRLAEAGYVAAAPDLYHRDGPGCTDDPVTRRSRLSDRRIINDINATVGFLSRQSTVHDGRFGVIGFCMGGRLAYLMAAVNPDLKAAVAYYPGNMFRAWGRDLPSPFERMADVYCPLQGHFGADDKNPSPEDMEKLDIELNKFHKAHEFYSYADAGHAFMDTTKESYRGRAADASWPRTLQFFGRYLATLTSESTAARK